MRINYVSKIIWHVKLRIPTTCTKCHENLLFRLDGLDFSMKVKIWLNFSRYSLRIPKGTLRFSSMKNIMTSMKKERTLSRFAESRIPLTIPSLSVGRFSFPLEKLISAGMPRVSIGPCFACVFNIIRVSMRNIWV